MNAKSLILNKWMLMLVLIAFGAGGYLYWNGSQKTIEQNRYRTVNLEQGDVTQTVSANGTLNPVVLVSVGTQVSGTVKKLYADFNDKVKQGQMLVELDPPLFDAQVQQSMANVRNAEASLELAQANEARVKTLLEQEYVSRQEYDQAQQALKSAHAQLALARAQLQKDRTNLGYTVIRAPVSGVVVSRSVDVGQTVAASFQTPELFKIAQDLSQMQIDSSFAEADIGKIKVGQKVHFTVDAFPGRTFEGTLKQVRLNPTNVSNVITYDVVVTVANPEQILLPGMTAYVNIDVADRHDVLLVPNAALRFRPKDGDTKAGGKQGGDSAKAKAGQAKSGSMKRGVAAKDKAEMGLSGRVYVLENGQPKAVRIRTGISDSKMTEVVSGNLKPGDAVIVEDTGDTGSAASAAGPGNMRMRMF
jgi:HlyD family secretion protein